MTIRLDAGLKQRIDKTAKGLGLSNKSLARLLLQRSLGPALIYAHLGDWGPARLLWDAGRQYKETGRRKQMSLEVPRKLLKIMSRVAGVRRLNTCVCHLLAWAIPFFEADAEVVDVYLDAKHCRKLFDTCKAAGQVETPIDFDNQLRKQLLEQTLKYDPLRRRFSTEV